jgi:hypothetical protein
MLQTVLKVLRSNDVVREGTVSDLDLGDYLLENGSISREEYVRKRAEADDLLGV